MKYLLPVFFSLLLVSSFWGCVVHEDRVDPNDTTIGATTGAAHVPERDFSDTRPSRDYEEIGEHDFDSLGEYDDVLTDQERSVLRERARDARDDPDDYLDYLTETEKANLRERAYDLIH